MTERAKLQTEAKKRNLTATGTNEELRERIADDRKAKAKKSPPKGRKASPKVPADDTETLLSAHYNGKPLTVSQVRMLQEKGYVARDSIRLVTKKGLALLGIDQAKVDATLLHFNGGAKLSDRDLMWLWVYGYLERGRNDQTQLSIEGREQLTKLGAYETTIDDTAKLDAVVLGWVLVEREEEGGDDVSHYRSLKRALEAGMASHAREPDVIYNQITQFNAEIEQGRTSYGWKGEFDDIFTVNPIHFIDAAEGRV